MKSISIGVFLLLHISCSLFAQQSECDHYIKTVDHRIRKKERQSAYPLTFDVAENMEVTLQFSDKASPNTLGLMLDFDDKAGLPTELGSTLSIKFVDGASYSIIAQAKKTSASIVYFTLIKPGTTPTSIDQPFKDKLLKIDISTLTIIADYKQREIHIPATKATIIKNTIHCLMTNK